jgi:hypothetical protein
MPCPNRSLFLVGRWHVGTNERATRFLRRGSLVRNPAALTLWTLLFPLGQNASLQFPAPEGVIVAFPNAQMRWLGTPKFFSDLHRFDQKLAVHRGYKLILGES